FLVADSAHSSHHPRGRERRDLARSEAEITLEHLRGVLAEARRAASRLDPEISRHERSTRIRNGAADLPVLHVAPETTLLIVRQVVVLFGRADDGPRDA